MDWILWLVTVVFSGIAGSAISIYWSGRAERYRMRLDILRGLLVHRSDVGSEGSLSYLNQILVVFAKEKKVIDALRAFQEATVAPERKNDEILNRYLELVKAMCRCLKVDISELDDRLLLKPFKRIER